MSGKLNYEDFKNLWQDLLLCKVRITSKPEPSSILLGHCLFVSRFQKAFKMLDTDKSMYFNSMEYRRALQALGERLVHLSLNLEVITKHCTCLAQVSASATPPSTRWRCDTATPTDASASMTSWPVTSNCAPCSVSCDSRSSYFLHDVLVSGFISRFSNFPTEGRGWRGRGNI